MDSVWLVSEGEMGSLGWDYEPLGVARDLERAKAWATAVKGLPRRLATWRVEPGFSPAECCRHVLDYGDGRLVVAEWTPLDT